MSDVTVLVVEDNETNIYLMQLLVTREGWRCVVARDGGEGVALALRERPTLIVMDLQLPLVSGYEAIHQLKANPDTASIPVVVVSAFAFPEERARALASGCAAYFTKPIETHAFMEHLRRLVV